MKNVSGEQYRPLFESNAFYRAERFEDVTAGIERALVFPDELANERAQVVRLVLGAVDGNAADRVADSVAVVV